MVTKEKHLLSWYLVVYLCQETQTTNCSSKTAVAKDTCSIRYDIAMGPLRQVIESLTCELTYTLHSICDAELKIWYFDMPPYIYTLPNGRVDGIFPGLLNIALKICCSNCTRVVYLKPFKSILETSGHFHNASHYSMMLPVLSVLNVDKYFTKPYLRLMDTPGVVFVCIDTLYATTMRKTLQSLISTWPLFVIILLLAVQGGVVIWILDAKKNPDDFPSSFIRGSLEGSWWAFVSMTTVGYGDKAPRSYFGRVFAIFWITIGITIMGIFTASLSSSLTSAALPEKTNLKGMKVGFYQHIGLAYEENIIHRDGGIPKEFHNVKSLMEALKVNDIAGILMDRFVFRYHWEDFKNSGLLLEQRYDIENSNTGLGVMFSDTIFENWAIFLNQFFKENKDAESRILKDAVQEMKNKIPLDNRDQSNSDDKIPGNSIYIGIIKAFSISSATSFFVGVIFELLKNYYDARRSRRMLGATNQIELKQGKKSLEERFELFSQSVEQNVVNDLREKIAILREDILKAQNNNT